MDTEAEANGRSTAQEIELRLELSRDLSQTFGGTSAVHFFRGVAASMTARYGDGWADSNIFDDEARDFLIQQLIVADIGRRVGFTLDRPVRAIERILNRLEDARQAYLVRLEDPSAMPPAPRTIRLLQPIKDDEGRLITELTLTEPSLGDLMAVDRLPGEVGRGQATIAAITGLPVSVVGRLQWRDLLRLDPEIQMLAEP